MLGMVSEREVIRHLLTTQVFSGADVAQRDRAGHGRADACATSCRGR